MSRVSEWSSEAQLSVQVGGYARQSVGIGQDVSDPVARIVVIERVGGGERQTIGCHRILSAHARPVLPQVLQFRDGVRLGELSQLFANGGRQRVARKLLRQALL